MDPFFFRVEHELLRSDSFKGLGGSAIKVYLVIGLYADFGTGWAYPSIRTIAKQAGLSRQTVLGAIADLAGVGMLATSKSKGRSTAYKVIRQAPPERPTPRDRKESKELTPGGLDFLGVAPKTGPVSLGETPSTGPDSLGALAQFLGPSGPETRPERDTGTREDSTSIPIPGTPFRLSSEGRLLVAVDLQGLLTDQGIPRKLAEKIAAQNDPEDVAKVLLNAFYLRSQGKLQNGPGYIRAGIEDGYELLPQVASRLESRRKEMASKLRELETRRERARVVSAREAEEATLDLMIERLGEDQLQSLMEKAVALLPEPIVRRNPTLTNPFVRAKVYELAGGEPTD